MEEINAICFLILSSYFLLEEQYGLSLQAIHPAWEARLTLFVPDAYITIFRSSVYFHIYPWPTNMKIHLDSAL